MKQVVTFNSAGGLLRFAAYSARNYFRRPAQWLFGIFLTPVPLIITSVAGNPDPLSLVPLILTAGGTIALAGSVAWDRGRMKKTGIDKRFAVAPRSGTIIVIAATVPGLAGMLISALFSLALIPLAGIAVRTFDPLTGTMALASQAVISIGIGFAVFGAVRTALGALSWTPLVCSLFLLGEALPQRLSFLLATTVDNRLTYLNPLAGPLHMWRAAFGIQPVEETAQGIHDPLCWLSLIVWSFIALLLVWASPYRKKRLAGR